MTGARSGPPVVAVVGPGRPDPCAESRAEAVGRHLADAGAVLVCGGLGGAMAAACRGAASRGGLTIGILPGEDRRTANPWVQVALATGLGELRNALVVRAADAVVAVGGGYGTLSEVALALRAGRPVVGLGTWGLVRPNGATDHGVSIAADAADAVAQALARAAAAAGPQGP